jgi:trigger factor
MEITETSADGLKREFKIAVPAAEIEKNVSGRLKELAQTINIPGFRPGKAPVSLLRKRYGPSVMGEVLEQTVNESSMKIMSENDLRPAMKPEIEITTFEDGQDLEYTMALEVLPEIKAMDFAKLELEKLITEPDETTITNALEHVAANHKSSKPVSANHKAKNGDIVIIDFVGKVDGEEFAGGKAEGYSLELGSQSFIPGFEDQLQGSKSGEHKDVKVTFPDNYGAADLAGKEAIFEVDVKEIQETVPAAIDDELAKKLGSEDLESLKNSIREEHAREYQRITRLRLKRNLLDVLADSHDFEVPQSLLDGECDSIWKQYEEQREAGMETDSPADAEKTDEERKAEFRAIAERRVRLGLLLAEVGRTNNIQVSQDEMNSAIMAEAHRYPGQEQAVLEHIRGTPETLEMITAPLYEEKVVDFILEMASVTEKRVSLDALMSDPDEDAPPAKSKKKKAPKKKQPSKEKK